MSEKCYIINSLRVCVLFRCGNGCLMRTHNTQTAWYTQTTSLFINNLIGFLLRHWNVYCVRSCSLRLCHKFRSTWIIMKFWWFFGHRNDENHINFNATNFFLFQKGKCYLHQTWWWRISRCRQCNFKWFSLCWALFTLISIRKRHLGHTVTKSLTYSFQSSRRK